VSEHLTLPIAQTIVAQALLRARDLNLKPLAVVVLDARGVIRAAAAEDGVSLRRFDVAHGKAYGALALGLGSRSIGKRAKEQPYFIAAVSQISGALVPVAGGVLMHSRGGTLLGSVGASGDTSDNDEQVVLAGIEQAGLVGDPGAD
jgi:uncharacterized protein GlcG (DUF336 family)